MAHLAREGLYAKPATERLIIDAYRQAFPNKLLMARYARDYAAAQAWLGFHDDMFPEDTDNGKDWSFLSGLRRSGRDSNWKQATIGGEMVPYQARVWLGPRFKDTLRLAERAHFSWVGPYCPALESSTSPEFRKAAESLVRRMGYQFRLTEVRHTAEIAPGGSLNLRITGSNEGVAPFYYSWPIELALFDSSGKLAVRSPVDYDIRTWQPGRFESRVRCQGQCTSRPLQARPGHHRSLDRRPSHSVCEQSTYARGLDRAIERVGGHHPLMHM